MYLSCSVRIYIENRDGILGGWIWWSGGGKTQWHVWPLLPGTTAPRIAVGTLCGDTVWGHCEETLWGDTMGGHWLCLTPPAHECSCSECLCCESHPQGNTQDESAMTWQPHLNGESPASCHPPHPAAPTLLHNSTNKLRLPTHIEKSDCSICLVT